MKLWDLCTDNRANLALYFGQDLKACGKLTLDRIAKLFDGKPYDNWRKHRENEGKATSAQINGIHQVVKAVGHLTEIVAKRGTR